MNAALAGGRQMRRVKADGLERPVDTGPTELSGRMVGLIGAYAAGAALDARELERARARSGMETVVPRHEGYVKNGIYHVAD